MSKKCHFRGLFDKQHGKLAQALFTSASQHLYHIDLSLPSQLSWKKFLLLTCQVLVENSRQFLNRDNLTIPIEMKLSEKQKNFVNFLMHF